MSVIMMASSETVSGVCNCGALKVTIPRTSFDSGGALCHCINCRASSGSLATVHFPVPTKDVITSGQPKVYPDKDTKSGHTVNRNFCGVCGTAVYSIVEENPDVAFVKGGLFTRGGLELPKPMAQVWMRSKEKWEVPLEGVRQVE